MDGQISVRAVVYVATATILIGLWALGVLRILSDNQRATVRVFGRLLIKGPGLTFYIPIAYEGWCRHSVGDLGVTTSANRAIFQGVEIPIKVSPQRHVAGTIKIVGFIGKGPNSEFLVEPQGEA
jgi:hypothetical protein